MSFAASFTRHGGAPVTGYLVQVREIAEPGSPDGSVYTVALPREPPDAPIESVELTVSDLILGQKYQFRVLAESKVGRGRYSDWGEELVIPLPVAVAARHAVEAAEESPGFTIQEGEAYVEADDSDADDL